MADMLGFAEEVASGLDLDNKTGFQTRKLVAPLAGKMLAFLLGWTTNVLFLF